MKNEKLGFLFLRIAIGLNIMIHGGIRFGSNYGKFVSYIHTTFENSPLPLFIVTPFAYLIPIWEFIVGLLLIIGLKTRLAAVAGMILMIILMSGTAITQNWNNVGIQMLYILCYYVLIIKLDNNVMSVDNIKK